MGIFDNLKRNLLHKKISKNLGEREIKILPLEKYHNILIIVDTINNQKAFSNHLQLVFPNAKFTTLTFRDQKLDESSGFTFTFHTNDMGFGKIKNDRLLGVVNTNFDLVIDFIKKETELDYFVQYSKSALKIGGLNTTKNYLYDLLIECGKSDTDFIENIKTQINLLTKNGNN